MPIRTLDLFCGAGGSSWGARQAGAEIVCGVDAWDLAARTYSDNFPEAKSIHVTLTIKSGPEVLGDIGRIDLILASPECTDHTCAKGGRERDEDSRLTARYVLNFAKVLKPRWIIIENVLQMEGWSGYGDLRSGLERQRYKVRPQELNASDFGIPQKRRRLFLICDRQAEPPQIEPLITIAPTAEDMVIDWTGRWKAGRLDNGRRALPTLERANRAIKALGRGKPFLIVYYGKDGAGGWQSLNRPLRTITTLDRFGLVQWDGEISTLRMLQVPELQRAMGFPDDFYLGHGVRRDKIKLLGNAVCPPVMETIVKTITYKHLKEQTFAYSSRVAVAG